MSTTAIELSPHELQDLCARFLKHDRAAKKCENNCNKKRDFQIVNYQLKSSSDAPSGFLGRHQYLLVELLLSDANDTATVQHLCFFTKSAPKDIESRMEYIEDFGVFKKEIDIYRNVLPHINRITAIVAPRCYFAGNNLLVFENLATYGFRMAAARDGLLDFAHLNCLLITLAALHAGSIIHELHAGKNINDLYPKAVKENAYPHNLNANHVRVKNFRNANKVFHEIIKILPKYACSEKFDFILNEFPKKMANIFELAQTSDKYKNVLCHGDLWANNVMFRYNVDNDKEPIDCRFVDFQLARYAPPILDVITILTIPTSRAFRERHLQELLQNYYGYLNEYLQCENLDINDFITEQDFYKAAQEFKICGIIESLLFSHLTVLPTESTQHLTQSDNGFSEFFDTKRVEICMKAFKTDDVYRERLTDMIEDLVDNFVL